MKSISKLGFRPAPSQMNSAHSLRRQLLRSSSSTRRSSSVSTVTIGRRERTAASSAAFAAETAAYQDGAASGDMGTEFIGDIVVCFVDLVSADDTDADPLLCHKYSFYNK